VDLMGKVVIVTGGGGPGCGRAISRRFASDGAVVVAVDVDEEGGRQTVSAITEAGGKASFVQTDVADEDQAQALMARVEREYGRLDVLVNNASRFVSGLLEGWVETFQVDLMGTLYMSLAAIDLMKRSGGGAIVNMTAEPAIGFKPHRAPAYCAAKAAVVRFSSALAGLREECGIRVNCLAPYWIAVPEVLEAIESMTPEDRVRYNVPDVLLQPEEIADIVYHLATDEGLAGRVMICYGGQPPRLIPTNDRGYAHFESPA